jgi:hypothetical protein
MLKEHTTGSTFFRKKRSAREIDFKTIKSAGIAIDCNKLVKGLTDPATNTKLTLLEFTEEDQLEVNYKWIDMRNKLRKYNLFSLVYDYTKDWTKKDIGGRISKYIMDLVDDMGIDKKEIEKHYPRMLNQYNILAFGIDLFNDVFETEFDRTKVIEILKRGRATMTGNILNSFRVFCGEAMQYNEETNRKRYLNHSLEEYHSRKYGGDGFFFTYANKSDFEIFTKKTFSISELTEQIKDGLQENHKNLVHEHSTGKQKGIFLKDDFFRVNIFERRKSKFK